MDRSERDFYVSGMFLGIAIGCLLLAITIGVLSSINKPIQPIDVYKGKTTLRYTIQDGVVVDSVVVWKNESVNK